MARLLEVNNLRVIFRTYRGIIKALNGVRLWLNEEERLGIVGETGCGKSVSALSIMRLIDAPGEIIEGQVLFEGTDLLKITEEEMDKTVRGKKMSMIFQEPISALIPSLRWDFKSPVNRSCCEISMGDAYEKAPEILEW